MGLMSSYILPLDLQWAVNLKLQIDEMVGNPLLGIPETSFLVFYDTQTVRSCLPKAWDYFIIMDAVTET